MNDIASAPSVPPEAAGRRAWPWLAALGVAAIGFRLIGINQESFWIDEVWSLRAVQQGVFHWVWNVESTPPLFFLLLKGWSAVFGQSHAALRAFSALAGGLAVPALYRCARRWGLGPWPAAVAALCLALSPFAYWQSQQNRYYGLLLLFGVLWLGAVPALLDPARPRRLHWPFVGWGFACFATHYYFAFYFIALAPGLLLGWLVARRDGRTLGRLALNYGVLGLFMATLLPLFLHQIGASPAGYLAPPTWEQLWTLLGTIYWAGVWTWIGHWRWPFSWRITLVVLLAVASLAGYGWALLRGRGRAGVSLAPGLLLGWAFLAPILLAFFFSRLVLPIFINDRYTILFLPPFLLCLCAGWSLWPRSARGAVLGLALLGMGALSLGTIPRYWAEYQDYDWVGMGRTIAAQWREGDALVFSPDWLENNYFDNGGTAPRKIPPADLAAIARARRVWLFMWEHPPLDPSRAALRQWRERNRHEAVGANRSEISLTRVEPGG